MRYFKTLLLVCALVSFLAWPTDGEAKKKKTVDIYELTLDDNLESPEPDNEKVAERVEEFQYEVAVKLKKHNLDVELMRDGQVIVVTFPAAQMFAPNDTALTDLGKTSLKPLLPFVKTPGIYKMLLVMHSDDTGSSRYTLDLTRGRVNSVFDWVDDNASTDFVVPYAMGDTDPVTDNNSMENRKRNRRLEIYLVPEEAMLAIAKKGPISMNILNINK